MIEVTGLYDSIYDWMRLITGKRCAITGYVIMPNHVHLLLFVPAGMSVNMILSNAKRFLAYEVIRRLQQQGRSDLLATLSIALTNGDVARAQKHRVWRTSSDIKSCISEAFVLQKLNYIHANPVSGKWSLAEDVLDYPHSSAAFYAEGRSGPAPLRHFAELL